VNELHLFCGFEAHAAKQNSVPVWLGTKRALVIVVQKNNLFGSDAWKIMHKIKPTITMMGIHGLESDIVKIDDAVKKGIKKESLPALLERFEMLCNQSFIELRAELKSL